MAKDIITKVVLALALAGFVSGPSSAAKKSPKGPPTWKVKVVNTPADPVPVIQAAPVPVTIPTPLPVVSQDPVFERIPYNRTVSRTIPNGDKVVTMPLAEVPSDIPNGSTLVVETISYRVTLPAGQGTQVGFASNSSSGVFRVRMPQTSPFVAAGGAEWDYSDAKRVRFYSRPGPNASGDFVLATAERNDTMGTGEFQAALSGYILVDTSPSLAP